LAAEPVFRSKINVNIIYMVKRVFKNNNLVRNLLILAVLLFIGFFVWTTLFKNTKILEGQSTIRDATVGEVTEIITNCRKTSMGETDRLRQCVTHRIDCELACNFTEADFKKAHDNSFEMPGTSLEQHTTEIVNKRTREQRAHEDRTKSMFTCPPSQRICPTKPPQQ